MLEKDSSFHASTLSKRLQRGRLLCGKPVYHRFDAGTHKESDLGEEMDKDAWIEANITDDEHKKRVQGMLVDWKLFEHGWLVDDYTNVHLFYYKTQIGDYGSHRPNALKYLQ